MSKRKIKKKNFLWKKDEKLLVSLIKNGTPDGKILDSATQLIGRSRALRAYESFITKLQLLSLNKQPKTGGDS